MDIALPFTFTTTGCVIESRDRHTERDEPEQFLSYCITSEAIEIFQLCRNFGFEESSTLIVLMWRIW